LAWDGVFFGFVQIMDNIVQMMMGAAGAAPEDYEIQRSLRFNSADSAYLSRTPASAGNRRTFTYSAWIKRGALSNGSRYSYIFTANASGSSASTNFFFNINDSLRVEHYPGSTVINCTTNAVFRDASAWYHIVFAVDTTQATNSNGIKIYVNGVQQTLSFTAYTQNTDTYVNATNQQGIGLGYASDQYFDGYQAEINFIDGSALTPSSFGETNPDTGVWQPIKYAGTYGTNGFYLNFSDNSNTTASTLGKDYSGNGNNWTPNNFSVTAGVGNDSLVDVPTPFGTDTGAGGEVRGNYAVLNPLSIVANASLSNGNLDATNTSGSIYRTFVSTIAIPSGSWYCEFTAVANTGSDNMFVGICPSSAALSSTYIGSSATSYAYSSNGTKYNNASATSYGASFTDGAVIGVAFNGSTLTFYKNGVSQGSAFTGLSGDFVFALSLWGTAVCSANFGQRPFSYTAPSGFKALVTTNLPTPTIGATSTTQAGKYFNTVLYTGTGSDPLAVTGVGFQPDFTWIKARSSAYSHGVNDAVRGAGKTLVTNTTDSEYNYGIYFKSFDSDGFTVGQASQLFNTNGTTYVGWNWKANGAGVSNTAGTITSTVSANTTAGISIVTYTGNGTAGATVGHGLGVTPDMLIFKNRDNTDGWIVFHRYVGGADDWWDTRLLLASTAARADNAGYLTAAPTSTLLTLSDTTPVNTNTEDYVAYCFAEVEGFSKFGSYTGNGSADGPFAFLGFRPAFVMLKRTDSTSNWTILDLKREGYNVDNDPLFPNLSNAEGTTDLADLLSNGFKLRSTDASVNASGGTYVFAAFSSNPFKFALAR
jgi:hypothetical protein